MCCMCNGIYKLAAFIRSLRSAIMRHSKPATSTIFRWNGTAHFWGDKWNVSRLPGWNKCSICVSERWWYANTQVDRDAVCSMLFIVYKYTLSSVFATGISSGCVVMPLYALHCTRLYSRLAIKYSAFCYYMLAKQNAMRLVFLFLSRSWYVRIYGTAFQFTRSSSADSCISSRFQSNDFDRIVISISLCFTGACSSSDAYVSIWLCFVVRGHDWKASHTTSYSCRFVSCKRIRAEHDEAKPKQTHDAAWEKNWTRWNAHSREKKGMEQK